MLLHLFPSLEFATEDFSGYVGGCVPGYSCAYMNTISWASETAGLPMEIDPRAAFERMFGRAGSPADRQVRRSEDRSILDSILQEARTPRTKVGASGSRPSRNSRTESILGWTCGHAGSTRDPRQP